MVVDQSSCARAILPDMTLLELIAIIAPLLGAIGGISQTKDHHSVGLLALVSIIGAAIGMGIYAGFNVGAKKLSRSTQNDAGKKNKSTLLTFMAFGILLSPLIALFASGFFVRLLVSVIYS